MLSNIDVYSESMPGVIAGAFTGIAVGTSTSMGIAATFAYSGYDVDLITIGFIGASSGLTAGAAGVGISSAICN